VARNREEQDGTVPCPYCGRPVYEDSPRCPHCASYISEEDTPPRRKPWWLIIGALVCLLIVLRWIMGG
jgi:hypothetical protein